MANISSLSKGLVAHYPLDGIHGTKDVTPNANHGTNYGATLSTGVKGESEGSYSFDGTDYIHFDAEENFENEFSISLWLYKSRSGATEIVFDNALSNTGQKMAFSSDKFFIRIISTSDRTINEPAQNGWN